MKSPLPILVFLSLFLLSCNKDQKPNVVFVFADQWRAQAVGYAGNPNVQTPNIDQLASEGISFTNAISTLPACTPYRGILLTGKYPLKTGVFMNDVSLHPDYKTLGEFYKEEGYETAYIGKWHLDGQGRSAFIPKERRQGFDYWKALECTHNYNNSKYWDNKDELNKWEGYDAALQTEDAVQYINDKAKGENPFCLVLSWGPPHGPYQTAPKEFKAIYEQMDIRLRPNVPAELAEKAEKTLKGYYAHCTALDSYIKQLQDAIKKNSIEANTIFIFTSDHGDMLYSHQKQKKQRIYDESAKIPFVLKYPSLFGKKGRKSDFLINTMDILPTLLGMSGIAINTEFDGEDVTDVLLGNKEDTREAALVSCIQPFGSWNKFKGGREFRGVITKRYTYAKDLSGGWLLFDNVEDPYQLNNLIENPNFQEKTKYLDGLLAQELNRLGDGFLPGLAYVQDWGHQVDSTGTMPYK